MIQRVTKVLIVFVWNLAFLTTRLKKAIIVEIKWSARLDGVGNLICYKIQTTRKLAILDSRIE